MFSTNKVFLALVGACLFTTSAVKAEIPIGGFCAGIAGPVKDDTCVKGSKCCYIFPDYGLCAAVRGDCPAKWIEEGGLCAGIAGPVKYPCIPGTTCCPVSPDNSICMRLKENQACPKPGPVTTLAA